MSFLDGQLRESVSRLEDGGREGEGAGRCCIGGESVRDCDLLSTEGGFGGRGEETGGTEQWGRNGRDRR